MGKEQWDRLRGSDRIALPDTAVQVLGVPLVLPGMDKVRKRTKQVKEQATTVKHNLLEVTNVFIRGQQKREDMNKREKEKEENLEKTK